MGIATLPTTNSTIRVVFCGDDDVSPHNEDDRGWIPAKDADISEGADVVEAGPLNTDQRAASLDASGPYQASLAKCRMGLRSVNGETSRAAINDWLARVPLGLIGGLGSLIESLTHGIDSQETQRALFRRDGDPEQ